MAVKLTDTLAKVLKMSPSEFAETYKIGEGEEADADSLKQLESKLNSILESKFLEGKSEGKGEATRTILKSREKEFSEKFNVKRGTFIEMGNALIDELKEKNKHLDPNDVQNSPVFINKVKEMSASIEDLKSQLTQKDVDFSKERNNYRIDSEFMSIDGFDYSNSKLVNMALNTIKTGRIAPKVLEGKFVMHDGDNVVRDEQMNPIEFKDWAKMEFGDILKSKGTSRTPGGQTIDPGGSYNFKTEAEAEAAMTAAESNDEKEKIIDWVSKNSHKFSG